MRDLLNEDRDRFGLVAINDPVFPLQLGFEVSLPNATKRLDMPALGIGTLIFQISQQGLK
jgi:hypothetical protein